jgi:hypothetical protein
VPGDEAVAKWITKKLKDDQDFGSVKLVGNGFLEITRKNSIPFITAAIGIRDIVRPGHVVPLFGERNPQFVVNVPSKAIWTGEAINIIHDAPAAFGTFGELIRASREPPVSTYRNKEYSFFERAFRQHTGVREVTRLYDKVFQLHRFRGMPDVTVVLIESYDMSAEDIRNARDLYGGFDAALKTTSYGSITTAANEAAESMGAEAFTFRDFLRRLNRP